MSPPNPREGVISEKEIYSQAMDTFRTVTTQVVSTGGFFVVGFVTVLGFALSNRSYLLLGASSLFMFALWALFVRWRWFVRTCLRTAAAIEAQEEEGKRFAYQLQDWMGVGPEPEFDRDTPEWRRDVKIRAPAIVGALVLISTVAVGRFVHSWSAAGNPPDRTEEPAVPTTTTVESTPTGG